MMKLENTKRRLAIAACLATAIGSATAFAHGGATGIVKERMDAMDSMAKAVKSLSEMFRGNKAYDAATVKADAAAIAAHGGEAMTKLFPEHSISGPSEAKPEIWSDWERFSALAGQLSDFAGALEQAADNPRAQGGMPGAGMMGGNQGGHMMDQGGMMGGGAPGGSMMGGGAPGGSMMGGNMMGQGGPTAEMLASMPPDAAFMHLVETCSACHQDFRKAK